MSWTSITQAKRVLSAEQGAVVKDWGGRLPVALLYPNAYHVGMSSLAIHGLYRMLNLRPDVACERVFCGYRRLVLADAPLSLETQRDLTEFKVLAVSFSFELDYLNFAALLRSSGIPALARMRDQSYPLVLAGGPAVSANPAPMSALCDAFFIGEVEESLPTLVDTLRAGIDGERGQLLRALAQIPGVYVPESGICSTAVASTRTTSPDSSRRDASATQTPTLPIARQWLRDLDAHPTHTVVFSRGTEFGDMYLLEIGRGCARGCRFCLAGCIYRPVRERSPRVLLAQARDGRTHRAKVGLVSAAVSDYAQIDDLLSGLQRLDMRISVSSLRVDPLPESLLAALAASGARTLTIAPEAGSERLRQSINKRVRREHILDAAARAATHRFSELKLYFMLGLPGEEEADVQAIVDLVRDVAAAFHGRIAASIVPFVPKAHTPFEREPMASDQILRQRMNALRTGLRPLRVRLTTDSLAWARVQAVLARGDHQLGLVLADMHAPSLAEWERALLQHGLNSDTYTGARNSKDPPPWGIVSMASGPRGAFTSALAAG